jgi:hypothetical protein
MRVVAAECSAWTPAWAEEEPEPPAGTPLAQAAAEPEVPTGTLPVAEAAVDWRDLAAPPRSTASSSILKQG